MTHHHQPPPPPPLPWVVHANDGTSSSFVASDDDGSYVPFATAPTYHSSEFQPQCFNPKQYKRVLKRRMARAKIEEMRFRRQAAAAAACKGVVANYIIGAGDNETTSAADSGSNDTSNNELPCIPPAAAVSIQSYAITATTTAASKRAYKHESRHRHAKKRPRGPNGRYLTKEQLVEYYKIHPDEDPSTFEAI